MALGKAVVNIMANLAPLKRGLMNAQVAVKKMVTSIGGGAFRILSAGLKKLMTLAKLAGLAILGIGAASVKIAMDAEETENLFVESMGNMTDAAREWVKEYSKSMGLFETETKKGVATLNVMFGSMGFGTDEAFNMSKELVKLGNDMASFYNLKPEEAFLKLQAGITGEAEGLKRLGILVNENTIQQMAMKDATIMARIASEKGTKATKKYVDGIGWVEQKAKKGAFQLTELEKVQLRYKAILQQTQKAQGDLGRTLDSTTNVFRTIKAQVLQAANNIGNVFMPMVTKVATAVRDWLQNNQDQIIAWAETIQEKIQVAIWWIEDLIALGRRGQWGDVFTAIGNVIGKAITAAVDYVKTLLPQMEAVGTAIGKGLWAYLESTPFGAWLKKTSEKAKEINKKIGKTGATGSELAVTAGLTAAGAKVGSVAGPVGTGIGAATGAAVGFGRTDARLTGEIFGLYKDWRAAVEQNNKLLERLNRNVEE